ncbi:MAG: 23S rRNA (pseudouridine(1915)-N(3))-methyltransferase RlmH [Bacilli bacterium]
MVNIKLIAVGKIKEDYLKNEINEYLKRLSRYAKISVIEVDDEKIMNNSSLKEDEKVKENEGKRLLKQIKEKDFVLLIDLHGQELDSLEFSDKFLQITNTNSNIDIVIAGSLGFSQEVIKRANYRLCLSKMTFTHQMTRAIILEQIYRAFKIINNETYHK